MPRLSRSKATSAVPRPRFARKGVFVAVAVVFVVSVLVLSSSKAGAAFGLPSTEDVGNAVAKLIGYLAYHLTYFLGKLMSVLFGVLIAVAQYNGFIDSDAVQTGWRVARDVCNMFFVMVLLVISFGTLFRMPQYRYTALLRKFVIMAVLINFSLGITGFFIDIMQLIMMTFVNAFSAAVSGNLAHMLGLTALFNLGPEASLEQVSQADVMNALLLGFGMMLVAFMVVLVMTIMFLVRIVALWLLAVMSPFAYFLSTFPHTQPWAKRWWSTFWQYATIGPILAFFLWLALTITGSGTHRMASELITTGLPTSQGVEGSSGLAASGTPVGFAGQNVDAFISQVGTNESLLSFMVGIILLVAGITIASRAGVAGGAFAGKVAGGIQRYAAGVGRVPFRAGKTVADFAYSTSGAQRLAEGAASRVGVGLAKVGNLTRIPGLKNVGRGIVTNVAARQKARSDLAKKQIEAVPTGTWAGQQILRGEAQVRAGDVWGGKWRSPIVMDRRKAARKRFPAAAGKDLKKLITETSAEDLPLDEDAVKAVQKDLMEQGTAIHLLNPAYAGRIMNHSLKMRKAAGYDEREGRKIDKESGKEVESQQGRYLWNYNQRDGVFEFGSAYDKDNKLRGVPVDEDESLTLLRERLTEKPATTDIKKKQEEWQKVVDETWSEKGKKKEKEVPLTPEEEAQVNYGWGKQQQSGGQQKGGGKGGGRKRQRMVDIGVDPEIRGLQEQAIAEGRLAPDAMMVGGITKGVTEGLKRARLLVNFSDPALASLGLAEHPTGSVRMTGEEKDEAVPVLEGKYRSQLTSEGVAPAEVDRLVTKLGTALRSAKELHLGNKGRYGTDMRTGLRHEDHHSELETIDDATLQEIFNELKPERQEEIKRDVRSQAGWGPDMSDNDVIKEFFATAAATFGRQKQYGALSFRDDERDIALQLKGAGVNIRTRDEVLAPTPPLAAAPAGMRRVTAQPAERIVPRTFEVPVSPVFERLSGNTSLRSLIDELSTRLGSVNAQVPRSDVQYSLQKIAEGVEQVAEAEGMKGEAIDAVRSELQHLLGEAASPDITPAATEALTGKVRSFLGTLRGGNVGRSPTAPSVGDAGGVQP